MKILNILKSKTINFNILAGSIYTILTTAGINVPEPTIIALLTVGNFVLRLVTKNSIADK